MTVIYDNNALSIGNTPLVRLNRVVNGHQKVYAKIEGRNPAYSVKCRIADMEIIEATSANAGIALAFVAAAKGYALTLTMPASMSLERRKVLKALGANIVLTDAAKGMKGAVDKAEEMRASNPQQYFLPQQFENPANPAIHETTTGPEIWRDTDGEIDIFVAGVGTGSTLTGVSRYIKLTQGKAIQTIAVEPEASPLITQALAGQDIKPAPHKIQGIGANFIPKNLDLSLVDGVETISNDEAIDYARRLMREEGILAGISCGAAVCAAARLAAKPENSDKTIVVILPDSGERYLSSILFDGLFTEQEMVQ